MSKVSQKRSGEDPSETKIKKTKYVHKDEFPLAYDRNDHGKDGRKRISKKIPVCPQGQ